MRETGPVLASLMLMSMASLLPTAAQAQDGGAAAATVPQSTGLQRDPAQLLAGTPTASAITMMPGETYYGPGPMTVGYLGAKKQIVLPSGAWVLLSAGQRPSGHATPVSLTTMVFGQFRDGQLLSLAGFLFNGRPVPLHTSWNDAKTCSAETGPRGGAKREAQRDGDLGCGWTVRMNAMPSGTDPTWDQAYAVLARLSVQVPLPPLQFTRAWATDNRSAYLSLRRLDFDSRPGTQAARAAWLQDYLPPMLVGLQKQIKATELEPDQPSVPGPRLSLAD